MGQSERSAARHSVADLRAYKADCAGKPPLLPRILNVQRSQLCYIVGTVYMDMPLKPNVLEDMARDVSPTLLASDPVQLTQ